ncbi:MAG: hypothetical protein WAT58_07265 [Candidatus Dormiibacterota bacterium]
MGTEDQIQNLCDAGVGTMTDAGRAQAQAQVFGKQVDVTEIQRLERGQKEVELAQTDATKDFVTASGPGIMARLNH